MFRHAEYDCKASSNSERICKRFSSFRKFQFLKWLLNFDPEVTKPEVLHGWVTIDMTNILFTKKNKDILETHRRSNLKFPKFKLPEVP